jgi:RHS repeat-associated protein
VQYARDVSAPTGIFDDGLRLEAVTYPKTSRVIFYGYEAANSINDRTSRIAEIRETNGSGTQLATYEYNGTGRLVRSAYPSPVSVEQRNYDLYGHGARVYNGFDRFGRAKELIWFSFGSNTYRDSFIYTYDFAGNRLTRDVGANLVNAGYPDTRDQKYSYDGLHRLLNYDQGTLAGVSITSSNLQRYWELDQLGNWPKLRQGLTGSSTVLEDRSHNAVNELTGFTTPTTITDPTYDTAGNLTLADLPENIVNYNEYPWIFTYDAWNRLAKVDDNEGHIVSYEYDGLGRRTSWSSSNYGSKHFYFNERWQLLESRVGSLTNPVEQFVWHPNYVDALAVRYWDTNSDGSYGTNEGAQFYCQDANYNVTSVLKSDGTVLERYNYTPYGQVTFLNASFGAASASAIANSHLYTGRERDPETGLQLNRHRYYASHLGRWLIRDRREYVDGNNLYEYVSAAPADFVDPNGTNKAAAYPCGDFSFKRKNIKPKRIDPIRGGDVPGYGVTYDPKGCGDVCAGPIKLVQVISWPSPYPLGGIPPHFDTGKNPPPPGTRFPGYCETRFEPTGHDGPKPYIDDSPTSSAYNTAEVTICAVCNCKTCGKEEILGCVSFSVTNPPPNKTPPAVTVGTTPLPPGNGTLECKANKCGDQWDSAVESE